MGDLRIGDFVIGSRGQPVMVTGVFEQGTRPVYRVTMSDNGVTECCAEHLWFTRTRNEKRQGLLGSVKSLAEILETLKIERGTRANHHVPVVPHVDFDVDAPRPLHPYALGLLLGDGSLPASGSVTLHNPERDIQEIFAACLPDGDVVSDVTDGITCRVRRKQRNNEQSTTKCVLADLGLLGTDSYSKFIPRAYLLAPLADRIQLLHGLMDTDGYVVHSGKSIEFVTSSPRLADDVAFLIRSLGGIVSARTKTPTYQYKGERRTGSKWLVPERSRAGQFGEASCSVAVGPWRLLRPPRRPH
jgi:phosphate starvation-inducible protein PhoH and related proteins